MSKKKSIVPIIFGILFIGLIAVFSVAFIKLTVKSEKINNDYSSYLKNKKYMTPVNVEDVECITQDVSCGYAVIEMFSAWNGGSVTEEILYDEYGKVVTSTGNSFCDEMNKRFPDYNTVMHKYLTNSEMIDLIYTSLSDGMPVPIEWAAKTEGVWTLHYSLVTGMDILNDTVTVANPYGYYENISIEEFLSRTRFDAYEDMPLFLRMGFAFGVFEKNTIFVIMRKGNENKNVTDLISYFQKKTQCPSVSAVTYNNGEITYYGDSNGLYQIGSMTKAFTGLAIQKLIIDGKISVNDYVSDYIGNFETFYNSQKAEITVLNLIEQKSGFTNNEKDYPSALEGMSLSEWAESISGKELKSLPGTEYAYSNTNYNLLGLIIEKVTGMSYKDYMEKEILVPLGLNDTYVGMPESGRVVEGSRLGYKQALEYSIPVRSASIPAGYFYSDTKDMGRWLNIWMGNEDIPEDFFEAIENTKKQLIKEEDYYSGWECFANDTIGHSGGTPNYSSRIVFSDKEKIGVCVLTNLNVAASTDSLCNAVYDTLSGQDKKDISQDVWTVFDLIFTVVSVTGILYIIFVLLTKKRVALIISEIAISVLFVLMLILFPMIFQAGLKEIFLTWAPLSMSGGLIILGLDIIIISFKLITEKKHARNYKTG